MRRKPELMQLEMGMSTRRYFPASGTAGLARSLVKGNSRVPWPPPIMTESTLLVLIDCRPVSDTLLGFIKNAQRIFPGKRGIGFRGAHRVVTEIEFVTVMNKIGAGRNGHQAFPAIGHQLGGAHRIKFRADDNLRFDAVPAQGLLAAIEGDLNRVKIVGVALLMLRGEICKIGGAPAHEQE